MLSSATTAKDRLTCLKGLEAIECSHKQRVALATAVTPPTIESAARWLLRVIRDHDEAPSIRIACVRLASRLGFDDLFPGTVAAILQR